MVSSMRSTIFTDSSRSLMLNMNNASVDDKQLNPSSPIPKPALRKAARDQQLLNKNMKAGASTVRSNELQTKSTSTKMVMKMILEKQ